MTIEAKIIADSISPQDIRLTTFQLRYPRMIHSEFMTHRLFSRNASSSRAIPVAKMIEDLRRDPAMPVFWGLNKPGMQAGDELEGLNLSDAKMHWISAMHHAIREAEILIELGLHKQIANRLLEPWAHINVVVTATDWNNFFTLRRHKDAQPEIKALADTMYDLMESNAPFRLEFGEWHLPYWNGESANLEISKKISAARCARVSYLTHDGRKTTVEEDVALYERLVRADVIHASPLEHQATPDDWIGPNHIDPFGHWQQPARHGNFRGWVQYRKTIQNEFVAG